MHVCMLPQMLHLVERILHDNENNYPNLASLYTACHEQCSTFAKRIVLLILIPQAYCAKVNILLAVTLKQ